MFFIIFILTLKPSILHVFPLFNTRKFQIMHCLQDGVQQSARLIDLVDAFNSSLASYLYSMLYVFITQWNTLLVHDYCLMNACSCLLGHCRSFPGMFSFCSSWLFMYQVQTCVAITSKHNCITSTKLLYNPSLIARYYRSFDNIVSNIFLTIWLSCWLISRYFDIIEISPSTT